ncbi:hypothetical protein SAMN02799624_02711 [Paenibacillus sp. UNC496MF]|uniref:DUF1802 family protein n=1 Tax=Paenibacillus sp. UNC496MF TaxID=1502753 RepID=UPI0008F4204A|nr:DUF1802 family protein [Paenibacillus sp. UNC496MF]SFI92622.1 hypothetical protein SAMN02799624_02711 [Paenibacillus sp. UNC496MF]
MNGLTRGAAENAAMENAAAEHAAAEHTAADTNEPEPYVALKEWAVAVKALAEGKQIMVLRKGGIAEETRDFRLKSTRFFLLPAYEHQRPGLLKEAYRDDLKAALDGWTPGSPTVEIAAYAEAADDIEIFDQETVDRLANYHIWTDTFTEERLKWKRKQPLHLLLLRVYRLERPVPLPMRDAYAGCKSWVGLEDFPEGLRGQAVLSDAEFARRAAEIRAAIAR